MSPTEALCAAVREGRYELTLHAIEEAADDDLHSIDIESAILTGSVTQVQDDPPRSPKDVVTGFATDQATRVGVVARFQPGGALVIITVYEIKD